MKLKVITPGKGIELDKEATLVEAEGAEGQFGILDGHIAFITPLKDQSFIKYQTKGSNPVNQLNVLQGVLEVAEKEGKTEVTVIASKLL